MEVTPWTAWWWGLERLLVLWPAGPCLPAGPAYESLRPCLQYENRPCLWANTVTVYPPSKFPVDTTQLVTSWTEILVIWSAFHVKNERKHCKWVQTAAETAAVINFLSETLIICMQTKRTGNTIIKSLIGKSGEIAFGYWIWVSGPFSAPHHHLHRQPSTHAWEWKVARHSEREVFRSPVRYSDQSPQSISE